MAASRAGGARQALTLESRVSGIRAAPPTFRLAVSNWLARNRGVRVNPPEEVIVVAGVAQALALLARTLRAAGLPPS